MKVCALYPLIPRLFLHYKHILYMQPVNLDNEIGQRSCVTITLLRVVEGESGDEARCTHIY